MLEILKQALEYGSFPQGSGIIHALKVAITELESQEPVGEVDAIGLNETDFHVSFKRPMPLGTKLYPHPSQRTEPKVCCQEYDTCLEPCTPRGVHLAQRTWVGLTNEEIARACGWSAHGWWTHPMPYEIKIAKAIEAKLKEKNT